MSLTTHEISADEHLAWWGRAMADPDRYILVYSHDGRDCGVVIIAVDDPAGAAATWSFYLDLDGLQADGLLLPAWLRLEREAVRYAFGELSLRRLGGETLERNTAVVDLHRRFGFRVTRSYDREVDGQPEAVVWTEMTAAEAARHLTARST